ncbi:hypothetical protein SDRG_02463 [Saprolegnia diclina VS20]|uniref:Uncharacterized protein n=1 Tax=Saprolegnia diclina (strain VS20) TaxID=1156394 RepID=T0R2P2_SAPDV|nr:hypothetical protein SDRG_02463 [Saprolegnia diclina VS20]EQC40575.1 hypothetical protein SDRG_02463 [Saprolegnia diclina VS20]|eukprot:XP_008606274.1 hypothetical protein SDRG_02463 [Saprolegnia diclina VS20]
MTVTDDVQKARKRIHNKKYRAANREKIAVKGKAYYAANADKERARKKTYHAANKEKLAVVSSGKIPPPLPKLADLRAQHEASGNVAPATSTDAAPELTEEDPHPLAATTKKVAAKWSQHGSGPRLRRLKGFSLVKVTMTTLLVVVMVTFTNEHPFNLRLSFLSLSILPNEVC